MNDLGNCTPVVGNNENIVKIRCYKQQNGTVYNEQFVKFDESARLKRERRIRCVRCCRRPRFLK